MKKIVFLLLMGIISLDAYAAVGDTYDDPIEFSWTDGHEQEPGTFCWYKVDLTQIPEGNDALLYLNNVDDATATITARPYVLFSSLSPLNDEVTKQILPNHNYAMTLSHAMIKALNTKVVYVRLQTDKRLRFSAEPVEPGEKNLDCINAIKFERTGTTAPAGTTWYSVDIADIKLDPSKTIEVSVTNQGTAATNVTAAISFDCPSTGTTNVTRSLAAGNTSTKVIDRALIDMLSVDLLYIQVQTTQPLLIKTETVDVPTQTLPVISGEIDFLLDKQYTLNAGEQWYKVNVKELRESGKIAELTLLTADAAATITADVAFSNPVTSITSRSISLGKNAMVVHDLARNLLESVSGDYAWVRLSTTASISFSARLKGRTEGTACLSARAFDWENGDWQTAETTVWYAVDIADAKSAANAGKDIMVTVENLSSSNPASVAMQLAFDCPYTSTTDATRTLSAGATQSKRIERSLYTNLMTDVVYVGLTTTQNLHITASLVDALETDWSKDCVLANAVPFDWENGNDQAAATAVWYKVDITPLFNKLDTVPEIVVSNLGTAVAEIAGELAFECPATEPTTQRRIQVAAAYPYVKTITRNLIETLASDVVYIRVETSQPIHIQAALKKENEGLNCANALDFDWANGNTNPAGKTQWYKIGLTDVKRTPGQAVRVGILNQDGKAGAVSANLYFGCDEDAFASYQMTLGANALREVELGRAAILNLAVDTVYIELTTQATDSLYANLYAEETLIDPIEACADALPVEYNTDIMQPAGEQWYYVDIDYLQKFTSGDATLTITNTNATPVQLKAELAWTCPVLEQMLDRLLALGGNADYSKVVTRSLIDNVTNDTAWIRVTASEPVSFRVDISDERGYSCAAPIFFDWVNGNTHPAPETLWYKVILDTLRYESEDDLHDFRLNVENLTDGAISATATIYTDCLDDPLADPITYSFEANEFKFRDIDRDLLENFGWAPLLIKFTSTGDVHLSAELITPNPDEIRDTTIVDTICAGLDEYVYTVGDQEYTINGPILRDTTLYDTLRFTMNFEHYTQLVDSAYKRVLLCKLQPEFILANSNPDYMPKVVAGKAIDTIAATQALLDAFAAQKLANEATRIDAAVTTIYWQIQQQNNRFANLKADDLLDTRTKHLVMRYVIKTECDDEVWSEPFIVTAEDPLRQTETTIDTVCSGTEIRSRNQTLVVNRDTTWNDTVFNLVHEAGVQLKDSVYYYDIKVWIELPLPTLSTLPTAQVGAPVDVTAADAELKAALEAQKAADPLLVPYTTITWEIKSGDNYESLTPALVEKGVTTIVLRYAIETECGTVYGDDITIKPERAMVFEEHIAATVCVGDEYISRLGTHVITEDTQWNDTVTFEWENTLADSVYYYTITVYRPITLPATIDGIAPLAVCGYKFDAEEATAQLLALLGSLVQPINSTVEAVKWEAEVNGAYTDLATLPELTAQIDEYNVRYVVTTSCGDELVSEPIVVAVQMPTPENTPELALMPAVSKYNNYLLMIHLNKFEEMGYAPTEDQVAWYKVVGNPDYESAETDDQQVATGYYYTTGEQLVGSFYSVVDIPALETNGCDVSLRTQLLTCVSTATLSLAPSVVAPGEAVNIYGLNPEITYTLSIYDLMGVFVERISLSGVAEYTFKAQPLVGFYMLQVEGDAKATTLKYIVK